MCITPRDKLSILATFVLVYKDSPNAPLRFAFSWKKIQKKNSENFP
jgi:hypothetical protein